MELKRIVAQDLRSATQEAVRLYGPNTLVVSSERIKGKMEVIAAVDLKPEPEIEKINSNFLTNEPDGSKSLSDEIAKESFENILSESLEKKKKNRNGSVFKSNDGREMLRKLEIKNIRNKKLGINNASKMSQEPKLSREIFSNKNKTTKVESFETKDLKNDNKSKVSNLVLDTKKKENEESLRAREIVNLVLREFSDMKKEFKLAQKVALFNNSTKLPIEVKSVADSLNEANIPVCLRTSLLESIAESNSSQEAIDSLKNHLQNLIKTNLKISKDLPHKGTNVLFGPTGAGKTSMLLKIISTAVKEGISEDSIAVISYKDSRLGAWSQTQMSCAHVGVEAFKVKDKDFLKNLYQEIESKKLILIDTSGIEMENNLKEINSVLKSASFHLVLPADTSQATFSNFCSKKNFAFDTLFISKFDESVSPWDLLQTIVEFNPLLAPTWGVGPSSFDHKPFDQNILIEKALSTLTSFQNDADSEKMIFESFKGFTTEKINKLSRSHAIS